MEDGKKKIIIYFFYLIVVMLVVSSAILIWPVYRKYQKRKIHVAELREQAALKTAECVKLNKEVYGLEHKPAAVEKVAREKFGLCQDGEAVMRYKDQPKQDDK
jgi:cell division protein FtsB